MDTYAAISKELKKYFSQQSFFKILLPLDVILFLGAAIYDLINHLPIIGKLFIFSSPFTTLVYYIGIIGALLTYANRKDQLLSLGFFLKALDQIIWFLYFLIRYGDVLSSDIVQFVVYGLIGLLILKRSYKNEDTNEKAMEG